MSAQTAVSRPVTSCLNCESRMRAIRGTLRFERSGVEIVIENVPMSRCDACDEQ